MASSASSISTRRSNCRPRRTSYGARRRRRRSHAHATRARSRCCASRARSGTARARASWRTWARRVASA
eukprot:6885552-Prymnesium_polylepis.1